MKLFSQFLSLASILSVSSQKIRGVNLGGWLVLEPWITPSLFDPYIDQTPQPVDEYTFCEILGKETALSKLKPHWDSWVTESHIAELAGAGINNIRIPFGYWAISFRENEPFVNGSFPYLVKAARWAKNHGIQVTLDLHATPGSQNGFDNSGRRGDIAWFGSEENISRVVEALSKLASYFNAEEFHGTVTAIELVNEPAFWGLDLNRLREFYNQAYAAIREKHPTITIVMHDAFRPLKEWEYLKSSGMTNIILDTHIYQVFSNDDQKQTNEQHLSRPCTRRADVGESNNSVRTVVGEFSLAKTDCARWLNGFNKGSRYEGSLPDSTAVCPTCKCDPENNIGAYDVGKREFLKKFAKQQMGVYESSGHGWFFWNFRTEASPDWDFLLGVKEGWINLHEDLSPSC